MSAFNIKRTPCTIITGFLGSGKTTIVRHLIETGGNRRLAVIVNEFGDIGIDGDILKSCANPLCRETDILELANGCLCCTVADDFVPALDKILSRAEPVDHILIETSGLALPKPLVQAFNWPTVKSRVTVDAVIAVVDGLALSEGRVANDIEALEAQRKGDSSIDHDSPVDEVFVDQIACADMVLLTKTDLLSEQGIESAAGRIRPHLKSSVKIVPIHNGQVDPGILLGLEKAVEDDIQERITLHDGMLDHEHDDFQTLIVEIDPVTDTSSLGRRVETLFAQAGVLRVKGYVEIKDKPLRYLVQSVGPMVSSHFDRPWNEGETRRSRLVVIGENGLDELKIRSILNGA